MQSHEDREQGEWAGDWERLSRARPAEIWSPPACALVAATAKEAEWEPRLFPPASSPLPWASPPAGLLPAPTCHPAVVCSLILFPLPSIPSTHRYHSPLPSPSCGPGTFCIKPPTKHPRQELLLSSHFRHNTQTQGHGPLA